MKPSLSICFLFEAVNLLINVKLCGLFIIIIKRQVSKRRVKFVISSAFYELACYSVITILFLIFQNPVKNVLSYAQLSFQNFLIAIRTMNYLYWICFWCFHNFDFETVELLVETLVGSNASGYRNFDFAPAEKLAGSNVCGCHHNFRSVVALL